ncbi:MAG: hypothetical protein LBG91_03810 [Treponema sp.]|jgi:hypothetical protein|nr:hypothetical protein [Treponema sp.]
MSSLRKYGYFCLFIFAAAVLSVSCSRTKPEISYGFMELVLYQGDTKPEEYFSFFIIPEDEDGLENLDELYLYHDREQLRWVIKSDEWIEFTQNGQTWIGTRGIAIQDDMVLPRGVYRAVLVNKGGEKGERNFTFDAEVRYPFPELEIADGQYRVTSRWPDNRLVCYDSGGNYSTTVELQSLTGSVSQLKLPSNVRTASLWAEDAERFCSAFTNAVSTR